MDLDVVVTDSKGHPIPDLTRPDFTVKVDGKPVPIDYFARVEEGTIHAPDLATASPERVLEEYRKGEDAYVPRHFLIYVDSGTSRRSRATARSIAPGLRHPSRALGHRAHRPLRPAVEGPDRWTASKETLLAAVDSMEKGVGMSRLMNEKHDAADIDSTRLAHSRQWAARNYVDETAVELDMMAKDMRAQLTTLTALPGKKAFLFVSGGLDIAARLRHVRVRRRQLGSAAFASSTRARSASRSRTSRARPTPTTSPSTPWTRGA